MMAMGLTGASAYFQKMANEVYGVLRLTGEEGFPSDFIAVMAAYLDDLSVGSETPSQHLTDLEN